MLIETVHIYQLAYSHGGDKVDQCGVRCTVSDIVTNINEDLKQLRRKHSSKLPPVPLCAVQIPARIVKKTRIHENTVYIAHYVAKVVVEEEKKGRKPGPNTLHP